MAALNAMTVEAPAQALESIIGVGKMLQRGSFGRETLISQSDSL